MRDRPDLHTHSPSDPLSDVLALLQVRSGAALRMTAGGPWALRFPAYPYLKVIAQPRGVLLVQVEGDAHPYRLEAGDCLLMRSGRPYTAATDLAPPSQDGPAHFAALHGGAVTWGDPDAEERMEGYASESAFSAAFKRGSGCAPGVYRQKKTRGRDRAFTSSWRRRAYQVSFRLYLPLVAPVPPL